MSVVKKLKSVVGMDGDSHTKKRYQCQQCDNEFESYKLPERTSCPECLSTDVDVLEEL
jgi:protein-arginine kinase activator protein McsA